MRNAGNVEHWIVVFERVKAGVVSERPFGAQLVEFYVTFQNDFSRRRNFQVNGFALYQLERLLPRNPAIIYSSTSGGAGTMAENVSDGSVPMATATSILPGRTVPFRPQSHPPRTSGP